jgi:RNA polymerase-binding transcription factor DksA
MVLHDDHPARLAEAEATLDAVDDALSRLDDGTYGRCDRCGGEIEDDRLTRDPTAVRCAQHADSEDDPAGADDGADVATVHQIDAGTAPDGA